MYPVLTLPVEITTEIFLRCLPDSISSSGKKYRTPLDEPPNLLTRVCRDWRAIAISTPSLWSHVHLEFGGNDGLRTGYIDSWWISRIETWLSRAQTQPLSIIISNLNHLEPHEALVGLLDSHYLRWRDLTLKLPFSRFYDFPTHESLPMLVRLNLEAHRIPPVIHTPITAFQHARILDSVYLGRGLLPSYFALSWGQISSLEVATMSAEDCLECLCCTPKVAKCVFEIQEPLISAALISVPPLLHLRSLTLTGRGPTTIFPYTSMPALEELDLAGTLSAGDLLGVGFFVARSACQLRRLRLYYISEALEAHAIQLLESLPFLESINLAVTAATTIISFLRLYDEFSFLPLLQDISITHHKMCDDHMPVMFRSITDVLIRRESSSGEHVQLCSFSLHVQHEQTAPRRRLQQRWQELSQRGMKLSMRNRYERWI
ncbi:hypothetical protein B0H11DRAFT_171458 [Mycena galericulata]|nr:hypothetical protein B0H11DRAFT_171458 [Mycena galericulata]